MEQGLQSILYTFCAPLVVMPGYEEDFKDKWMEITLHRVKHQAEIFQHQQCTEFEAMLYISTATLVAPPSHDWFQMYMWLFQRWKPDMAEEMDLKPDRPKLDPQQAEQLARLRQWIFRRQQERLKERFKEGKAEKAPAEVKPHEVEVIQAKLF